MYLSHSFVLYLLFCVGTDLKQFGGGLLRGEVSLGRTQLGLSVGEATVLGEGADLGLQPGLAHDRLVGVGLGGLLADCLASITKNKHSHRGR